MEVTSRGSLRLSCGSVGPLLDTEMCRGDRTPRGGAMLESHMAKSIRNPTGDKELRRGTLGLSSSRALAEMTSNTQNGDASVSEMMKFATMACRRT